MFDYEIPNELILIAASAIANPNCGRITFSMLDTCEWQVMIGLDPSVGSMAQDVYLIVRSQSQKPLTCLVANSYAFDPDIIEKPFVCLGDLVSEAIGHFRELQAV
jgi:hypothetical protein